MSPDRPSIYDRRLTTPRAQVLALQRQKLRAGVGRRVLLAMVTGRDHRSTDLAETVGSSTTFVPHLLARAEECGLVERQGHGKLTRWSLTDDGRAFAGELGS